MTLVGRSADEIRGWLARLGRLAFDDFCLLDPATIRTVLSDESDRSDWSAATSTAPHVLAHFRRSAVLPSASCALASGFVLAARSRLVHKHSPALLLAKAPPLYDALPWHDWDFSVVTRAVKVWQTRFLFAGCGTTVACCRPRRPAGVYVALQSEAIVRYVERKAGLERVRHISVLRAPLDRLPLPDRSADFAAVGGSVTAAGLSELSRVAARILVVDNDPLGPPPDEGLLRSLDFRQDEVAVRSLGRRPYWRRG